MNYSVLAYYEFVQIDSPEEEVKKHKAFLETLDGRGRIYISEEGINGQLSVATSDLESYLAWLKTTPFAHADVKVHTWHEHPFAKLTVKRRAQLVALDRKVEMSQRGEHLAPAAWREILESGDENTIVIDVRNRYESEIGHFEGALTPDLETFRDFPAYVKELASSYDKKKTRVLMYCTGGIRCELYSPLLKEEGFEEVYQLQGGVIKYGLEEGTKHWNGKLFVFDDRLVVPISEEREDADKAIISKCHLCTIPADTYYNCANMDCNKLFTACSNCIAEAKGCCCSICLTEGRVRPFTPANHPKPFRKLPHEEKLACRSATVSA